MESSRGLSRVVRITETRGKTASKWTSSGKRQTGPELPGPAWQPWIYTKHTVVGPVVLVVTECWQADTQCPNSSPLRLSARQKSTHSSPWVPGGGTQMGIPVAFAPRRVIRPAAMTPIPAPKRQNALRRDMPLARFFVKSSNCLLICFPALLVSVAGANAPPASVAV